MLATTGLAVDDRVLEVINDDAEHAIIVGMEYKDPIIDTVISINRSGSFIKLFHRKKPTTVLIEQNITDIQVLN